MSSRPDGRREVSVRALHLGVLRVFNAEPLVHISGFETDMSTALRNPQHKDKLEDLHNTLDGIISMQDFADELEYEPLAIDE